MADFADPTANFSTPTAQGKDLALPQPQPLGAPVLISDCATPLCAETLLSLLWKRLDAAPDPEDP